MEFYDLEKGEISPEKSKDFFDSKEENNVTAWLDSILIKITEDYLLDRLRVVYKISKEEKEGLEKLGFYLSKAQSFNGLLGYTVDWSRDKRALYAMINCYNKFGLSKEDVEDTCRKIVTLIQNDFYECTKLEFELRLENVNYALVGAQLTRGLSKKNIRHQLHLEKLRLRDDLIYGVYSIAW